MSAPTRSERFQRAASPHLDAAYNLARWVTRNNGDAEDIVQEAYLRAFRFFDGLRDQDARAWLLTVVRNTAYTWLRQNREHSRSMPLDEGGHGPESTVAGRTNNDPEAILLQKDGRRILNRALEQLPVEFREVLVLRGLEELSYKEIARVAGIPIGTVMSRLARGRKLLAERMAKEEEESVDRLQKISLIASAAVNAG